MEQSRENITVLNRADYIKLARDNCNKNINGVNHNSIKAAEQSVQETSSLRRFLTRCVCALLILVAVIIFDKINIQFKTENSKTIESWITSSQGIEDAENFFVSLYEKFNTKE